MEIYAELSRKQHKGIIDGIYEICVPYGVEVRNKIGTRGLFFDCENEDVAKELIDGLDASEINWQANGD